ncbi:TetR/AcrR family transcriptional regulator [Streptomyces sp. NPDC006645]|uniref:TetR/AcrR family transcriptional regulator n=1 Tax=unclassified Streptomyces TaxID=2593676 RepID=UPI0033A528A4
MGLRETKMERTRQLIADNAFELFVTQGYEETTIEQIAAASEVGTRTLYRYYATKEALVVDFVEEGLTTALTALVEQPDDLPLPQALHAVIDSIERTVTANSGRLIALYEMTGRTAALRARLADQNWRWRQALDREITRRMGDTDPGLLATLTAAATVNVVEVVLQKWVDSGGTADVGDIARASLRLMRTHAIPVPTPA